MQFLPPEWERLALCAQVDPELWFPEKGGSTLAAKKICRRCPVQEPCLDQALEQDDRFGVRGGFSERQRRKLTALGIRRWRDIDRETLIQL